MPFITARVNVPVKKEQELMIKSRLGKAIEAVPGKSEEYLLCNIEDNRHMYLRGNGDTPIAYIEAAIWGNEGHLGYDRFTAEATLIFSEILNIAPDHVYIRYSDIPDWGVGGINFDRNSYA
ncbi:MAG: hypothetical protein IJT96_06605 [Lachnospiraceae bacterium]|nr:hypothetical protein [Lachnospiraceae bacterium]